MINGVIKPAANDAKEPNPCLEMTCVHSLARTNRYSGQPNVISHLSSRVVPCFARAEANVRAAGKRVHNEPSHLGCFGSSHLAE